MSGFECKGVATGHCGSEIHGVGTSIVVYGPGWDAVSLWSIYLAPRTSRCGTNGVGNQRRDTSCTAVHQQNLECLAVREPYRKLLGHLDRLVT